MLKRNLIPIALCLLCLMGALYLSIRPPTTLQRVIDKLDYLIFDLRTYLTLKKPEKMPPIAIVDIDEKSLNQVGRWPWPRDKLAELLQALKKYNVSVIALDMVFAEPEQNIIQTLNQKIQTSTKNKKALPDLEQYRYLFDNDKLLHDAIAGQNVVLGYILHNNANLSTGQLNQGLIQIDPNDPQYKNLVILHLPGKSGNISQIQSATESGGFISSVRDSDGVLRRAPLAIRHNNTIYPSLALKTAMDYLLYKNISLQLSQIGDKTVIEGIRLGNTLIPTDEKGFVIIPFFGPGKTIPYYSATDVMQHKVDPKKLEGAIIFVGTSALGLGELQATPVDSLFPGVEMHANIVAGILMNKFKHYPAWSKGAEFVFILLFGLLFSLLLPILRPSYALILFISSIALIIGLDLYAWIYWDLFFQTSILFFMLFLQATISFIYGFFFERRQRTFIHNLFGQYVSKEHITEITRSKSDITIEGQTKVMSVLFTDIRNFTHISESLSATGVKKLLNEYLTPITEIVFNTRGTIDKYVGDMLMAFWNAPLNDPNHAKNAVLAGLAILEKTRELQPVFKKMGLPVVRVGVGINTGLMNVGDMGSQYRRAYTVLGDAVNLASRLESLTKFYQVGMLVSEYTKQELPEFTFRKIDYIRVKGRDTAIEIYEPISMTTPSNELIEELAQYDEALTLYTKGEWDRALEKFKLLQNQHSTTYLYKLYIERIQKFIENGTSQGWDGIFTHAAK